mmetsp:Transcript_4792/g.13273  ORF Transcript_4792/g.13273 Transcript_4792/m.13273 type:complete len:272 (+) Transcript_4792:107-922(+)
MFISDADGISPVMDCRRAVAAPRATHRTRGAGTTHHRPPRPRRYDGGRPCPDPRKPASLSGPAHVANTVHHGLLVRLWPNNDPRLDRGCPRPGIPTDPSTGARVRDDLCAEMLIAAAAQPQARCHVVIARVLELGSAHRSTRDTRCDRSGSPQCGHIARPGWRKRAGMRVRRTGASATSTRIHCVTAISFRSRCARLLLDICSGIGHGFHEAQCPGLRGLQVELRIDLRCVRRVERCGELVHRLPQLRGRQCLLDGLWRVSGRHMRAEELL